MKQKNKSNFNKIERKIHTDGKELNNLYNTGFHLSLISYENYLNVGMLNLFFDNFSINIICKEIISPLDYFSYELCLIILNFLF